VVNDAEVELLVDSTDSFWWIWTTDDPDGYPERRLQTTGIPAADRLTSIATRDLSTGGLHAVLYRVVR
jgi:hypothetical protein